jgi:hypothetical protein
MNTPSVTLISQNFFKCEDHYNILLVFCTHPLCGGFNNVLISSAIWALWMTLCGSRSIRVRHLALYLFMNCMYLKGILLCTTLYLLTVLAGIEVFHVCDTFTFRIHI